MEVNTRVAAPMVGDTVTAPLLSMLVVPAELHVPGPRRLRQRGQQVFEAGAGSNIPR